MLLLILIYLILYNFYILLYKGIVDSASALKGFIGQNNAITHSSLL